MSASTPTPAPAPNPKDSIKSTWRLQDRSTWTIFHWAFELMGIHPVELDKDVPVHPKEDLVPYLSEWYLHRWVIFHAAIPLLIHEAYCATTGRNLSPVSALIFYALAFKLIAIRELRSLRKTAHSVGFLDGDVHERDGVPDVGVAKTLTALLSTSTFRPVLAVFLAYRTSQPPSSISWAWLPLEAGLYGIILDFWFYWYHRAMHEVKPLWRFHRTHHLTKHPNPLLTLYADVEQEFFDIAGIPLATYFTMRALGMPMGFYEWWVCHQYVMFAELAGHSGLRLHAVPPNLLSWFLRMFKAELVIEDHDLHHRKGWRTSGNYGKQTRLWDRIFGTCRDRIETVPGNIDWSSSVDMPLFF